MADRVTGKVNRIFTGSSGAYIRLAGLPADSIPKDGYFLLGRDHVNYDSLYSLVLTAAVNRFDIQIKSVDQIDPNEYAAVQYMVITW